MNASVVQFRGWLVCNLACATLLLASTTAAAQTSPIREKLLDCYANSGVLCAETLESPPWTYIGHDEPSLLFYSNQSGSGYTNIYRLTLPKDPPLAPKQNGHGGTWNFQLHPAFWFGMAMCDDQSAPNPAGSPIAGPNIKCKPASDANIYDGPDASKPDYIGKHPGTAFMEMQFYPPGWITGNSPTQWTAALNIDSDSENQNTGQGNNPACGGAIEYVNFAFIQTDGVPFPPGSPSPLGPFVSTDANTLFMNPGDELVVTLADTEHGLKVTVQDLTSGQTGFMVASAANGFAQILYDPNGNNCDFATHNLPYDFHPMYATSSEHTRVPWAAHSYNIAFSDEIGHFEYCDTVATEGGACTSTERHDPAGIDDNFCFDGGFAASFGLTPIGGCIDSDVDFDGVPYRRNTWPGTLENSKLDSERHAQPVIFTSPLFIASEGDGEDGGGKRNFNRVAFEADIPRVETNTNPPCQRHLSNPADPSPGAGCVNPPVGADFYPIYTTRNASSGCVWQLGGAHLPGTTQTFGGTSTTEYGAILASVYPASNGIPQYILENFHRTLPSNPCPASIGSDR
jgi:hypothetical protein